MKMKFAKIVSMLLVFTIISGMFTPVGSGISLTAYAAGNNTAQKDRANEGKKNISDDVDFWNDINVDQSFAHQVRIATNYANRQYSVGNSIGGSVYGDKLNMSNIAPFYGYTEGEVEYDELNSPENTRSAVSDTKATLSYSKNLLATATNGRSDGSAYSSSYNYYSYGLLLNLIGFDSVGTNAPDQTRNLYGWLAQASYFAASSVNMIFEACFDFLWATNPFIFFKNINTSTSGKAELEGIYDTATGAIGGDVDKSIGALATFFGNIFNTFTDFAWTVSIPLSLLFIIITYFLTRRGRYSLGSNIKKFIIRVVFVAIGIPILGAAYTQVLDGLRDTQVSSDEFISQAVSYTFLDFRKWVENNRLAPPDGCNLTVIVESHSSRDDAGSGSSSSNALVSGVTMRNLRQICSYINTNNGLFNFSDNNGLSVSNTGVLLRDYIYDTSSNAVLSVSGNSNEVKSDYSNRQAVNDILKDYTNGVKYTATMFESGAVAWMQSQSNSSSNPSAIAYGDMLALSADKYSFSQNAERQIHWLQGKVDYNDITYDPANPGEAGTYSAVAKNRFAGDSFAGIDYNIWNNGDINATVVCTDGSDQQHSQSGVTAGTRFTSDSYFNNAGYDCGTATGLSTMSMYTYLTSEFTQAGILTYGNSSSVYTHNFHYAVNLIGGNSIMQFAFLANMLAILLGYFFLAVAFVFRTAFDILFKGFQLMGHALLAAAGFYKSIGTCICMVVNMIAQLFITVIFFSFMVDFMFMLSSIFNKFFFDIFDAVTDQGYIAANGLDLTSSTAYASEVIVILSSFISTFAIIFFVSFASKWRSLIMSTINGMVENIVGTLLGVNLGGASDGVMGGMAKSAFRDATNVSMAAAAVGGGVALADGLQDIANDVAKTVAGDGETEETSAVDGAVNPTVGSGFNGGKGAEEGDQATKAEGLDALENGLGEKNADDAEKSDDQYLGSGTVEQRDTQRKLEQGGGSTFGDDTLARKDNDFASQLDAFKASIPARDLDGSDEDTLSRNSAPNPFAQWQKTEPDSASQTEAETGAESEAETAETETPDVASGVSFDAARGLVMTSVGDDGTVSDVAIGLNGVSLGSTDAEGNRTVNTIGMGGMQTEYTGADGTTETTTTTFDGLNSNVTVERTDADGNSETITSGLNGSTVQRTEKTEDGSIRTTTTNPDGTQTVETDNAETGYHSVKNIAADGSSEETETVNGVTTVTDTNADGVITEKVSTSTGADGQENVTSYKLNDDGSVTRSVQAGGTKTTTVENTDGTSVETQSVALSNGTLSETTTNYDANGRQTGDVDTVVRSSDGRTVLSTGKLSSGSDDIGAYTMSTVSTAAGSVQRKDYGNGHVITTETAVNGDMAVTEARGDGSYKITETEASTGEVKTISIDQNGHGHSSGGTFGSDIGLGSDGSLNYVNIAGGTFTRSETGEGSDRADVVSMSYAAGGSDAVSTNHFTGNTTSTTNDGMGGTSTVTVDSRSGATEVNAVKADGTTIHSVTADNGDFTETVTQANGGVRNTVRMGSGDNAIEKIVSTDGAGNTSAVTMEGGRVTYRSGGNAEGASYVQTLNSSGNWETTQTLASGDSVHIVTQSDGDFTRTVNYANGAVRTEVLEDGVLNVSTKSVSGIETSSMRTGSASVSHVQLDGMSISERTDAKTGTVTQTLTVADQQYEVVTETDGSSKTSFMMPNGAYGSFKTNADGSEVHIIRQLDKTSRIETIGTNGESSVVYTNAMGLTVTEPNESTKLNDMYAESIGAFNKSMTTVRESFNKLGSSGVSSLGGFEIPAPTMQTSMHGMMTTDGSVNIVPGDANEEFNKALFDSMTGTVNLDGVDIPVEMVMEDMQRAGMGGEFGRYDTMTGGSATSKGTDKK